MDRRLGFVGIIIEDRKNNAAQVNSLLSAFGDHIIARTGVPQKDCDRSVITIVIEATTDELGRLTGKLGSLPGVSVKSALSKQKTGDKAA